MSDPHKPQPSAGHSDDNAGIENVLEKLIFNARWLLVPFYLALAASIGILLARLLGELGEIFHVLLTGDGNLVLSVLGLVDLTLVANLLVIVIFSGYENFISRLEVAHESPDKPQWMGKVTYSDLKLKLIGSIVAISAIDLLKAFVNVHSVNHEDLAWMLGVHGMFLFSGVMFALMDRIATPPGGRHH